MNKAIKFVIVSAGAYGCYRLGRIVGIIETTKCCVDALDETFPESNVKKIAREYFIEKLLTKKQ